MVYCIRYILHTTTNGGVIILYLIYFIFACAMVAADFAVKYAVVSNMRQGETIPVIENVFHITYVKNTGAAFSMLAGKMPFLIILTAIIMLGILGFVILKRPKNKLQLTALTMIFAGGIGNMIDRISRGCVVDMFDFRLINFAVFNVADIFVVCGAVLLVIYTMFFDVSGDKNDNKS